MQDSGRTRVVVFHGETGGGEAAISHFFLLRILTNHDRRNDLPVRNAPTTEMIATGVPGLTWFITSLRLSL